MLILPAVVKDQADQANKNNEDATNAGVEDHTRVEMCAQTLDVDLLLNHAGYHNAKISVQFHSTKL